MGVRVSLFTIVVLMCYIADCEMRGRVRRALKDTARAQMVNMLPDTDGAQNYPLRPYRDLFWFGILPNNAPTSTKCIPIYSEPAIVKYDRKLFHVRLEFLINMRDF